MGSPLASLKPFADAAQALSAIIAACTFLVGAGTLWKSILEYRRANSLKRFEKFQEMRKRFENDGPVKWVAVLLVDDNDELSGLDYRIKEDFLGFYEEIAIMNNSTLLSDNVTYYMFGYYALRAYESEKFRQNINLDSPYWALFCLLCVRLQCVERDVRAGRKSAAAMARNLRF